MPEKRVEWEEEEEDEEEQVSLEAGLGAIFQGIDGIMSSVKGLTDLASQTATGTTKMTGGAARKSGRPGTTGMFGFSIGQLSTGEPKVEPFGNIRPTEKGPAVVEVREPMVDLFEDEDHILVVAELPGVAEKDISFRVAGDVLHISSGGQRKYEKELSLPVAVDPSGAESTYNNGVLQLKLKKTKQG